MSRELWRIEKIMVVRHAEKPTGSPPPYGVTEEGEREDESLTVRGWQRAGALAALLAPPDGAFRDPALAEPRFIYASKPTKRNGSRRSLETVTPLADRLAIKVNEQFPKGDYEEMLEEALCCRGVVLISWQHDLIPGIAKRILDGKGAAPREWPDDRYDVIWVFDRDPESGLFSFTQVPQNLLAGDRVTPIRD